MADGWVIGGNPSTCRGIDETRAYTRVGVIPTPTWGELIYGIVDMHTPSDMNCGAYFEIPSCLPLVQFRKLPRLYSPAKVVAFEFNNTIVLNMEDGQT